MRRISFWLVLLLAASIPLEGIGEVGPALKVTRLAALLALAAVLLAICAGSPVRRVGRVVACSAAFTVWVVLSYFWSIDPDVTLGRALTFMQLLVLVWVVWQEATTEERCTLLMKAYIVGAALAIAYSLVRGSERYVERLSLGDPNTFGVLGVIGFAFAAYLVRSEPRSFWGWACRPFMLAVAVAVVLTASRTAVAALVLTCLVIVLDRRALTLGRFVVLAVALFGFLFVAGRVVEQNQLERLQSVETELEEGSLAGRLPLWQLGWDLFTDRPVTGIGAATFRTEAETAMGQGRAPHSTFVGVGVELGAVGLALLLLVVVSAGRDAARLPPTLRRTWLAVGLAWCVASVSLSWELKKITWFLVALAACQARSRLEARHVGDRATDPGSAGAPHDELAEPVSPGVGELRLTRG